MGPRRDDVNKVANCPYCTLKMYCKQHRNTRPPVGTPGSDVPVPRDSAATITRMYDQIISSKLLKFKERFNADLERHSEQQQLALFGEGALFQPGGLPHQQQQPPAPLPADKKKLNYLVMLFLPRALFFTKRRDPRQRKRKENSQKVSEFEDEQRKMLSRREKKKRSRSRSSSKKKKKEKKKKRAKKKEHKAKKDSRKRKRKTKTRRSRGSSSSEADSSSGSSSDEEVASASSSEDEEESSSSSDGYSGDSSSSDKEKEGASDRKAGSVSPAGKRRRVS